jgi:hypothetical protein
MEAVLAALTTIGPILYALGAAALLDTVTGVWAAYRSGTFNKEFLPTFFTSHIVTKVAPIIIGLVGGVVVAGSSPALAAPILAVSGTAAAAYLAAVIGSVVDNISEGRAEVKGAPTSLVISAETNEEL